MLRKILVIYTGGTIGMVMTESGYDVKANYLSSVLKSDKKFNNIEKKDWMVISNSPENNRIEYQILEYDPLLDSSEMNTKDWIQIGKDIQKHYDDYDAFIVLHGTDTMAYTASALSFMIENLTKPIIITGSQIPISCLRNDSSSNLLDSLIVASDYPIPEVLVCFNHKLMRGNRTIKASSDQLNAFQSPNMDPIVEIGINVKVNRNHIRKPNLLIETKFHLEFSDKVGILYLYPGISSQMIKLVLSSGLQGFVLKTFGAGNFSQEKAILDLLKEANDTGIVFINTTQCYEGSVDSAYATGQALLARGIIPGHDMTTEAALTKLSYLLGRKYKVNQIREIVGQNIRGELTETNNYNFQNNDFVDAIANAMGKRTNEDIMAIKNSLYPILLCTYASQNKVERMRDLICQEIDLNLGDYDGRRPIHLACANNAIDSVLFLLELGVDPNVIDNNHHTPMYEACLQKNFEIIEILNNTGAKLLLKNDEACTNYCYAVKALDFEQIRAWGEGGADFTIGDYDGRTPFDVAKDTNNKEVIKILEKYSF